MLDFGSKDEADRVFRRGARRGFCLYIDGGLRKVAGREGERLKDCWVRVVGLLLHFWNLDVFKKIGDSCGGLIRVDEGTSTRVSL